MNTNQSVGALLPTMGKRTRLFSAILAVVLFWTMPGFAAPGINSSRFENKLKSAKRSVIQQIGRRLQAADAPAAFFKAFNGGLATPSATWQARLAQLRKTPESALDVPVQLLENKDIRGAYAAFARSGIDGKPAIYINYEWMHQSSSKAGLERLLTEEMGHAVDAFLNGGLETPGDEGEAFALAMLSGGVTKRDQNRIAKENDISHIVLQGREIIVEEAAVYFNEVFQGTGTSYTVSTNSVTNIQLLSGNGFKFTSVDPNASLFAYDANGNDVSGTLTYVNASSVVTTVSGVMSRQRKANGNTQAFYFVNSGTGTAFLFVIPGFENNYSTGDNVNTSSDPNFLNDLNGVLTSQQSAPIISVSSPTVSEGAGYAVFTISLSNAANAAISFTPSLTAGSASASADYVPNSIEWNNNGTWVSALGTLTMAQGVMSMQIRVYMNDDPMQESTETFSLSTGAITGGNVLNNYGSSGVASIQDNDVPPSGLSYTSPNTFTIGTAITPLQPTVTGTVMSYTVSPALPAGLALHATTGVISGTPTAVTATTSYTVTAANMSGNTTFAVSITVNAGPPVFTSTPVTTATVAQAYSYSVTANDPGNLPLTISGVTVPSWLSFSTNGQSTSSQFGSTVPSPGGIAGDAAGNIYVTSVNGTTIYKIAPDGTTTSWFTRQAGNVYGMLVIGNDLYVSYYSKSHNNDITKINLTGTPSETTVTTQLGSPLSMVYKNGIIYVADYGFNKVSKIDLTNGNAVSDVVAYNSVFGLGFNSSGLLYMASHNSNKVSTVDITSSNPTGTITDVITGLSFPTDVKIDANNNVYVSGSGYVRKYVPNLSSFTTAWSGNGFVVGMSLTPSGTLVFGLYSQSQVHKLQTGAILTATPAIGDIGVHPVLVRATNGSQSVDQSFNISVSGPSTFTLPNLTNYVGDAAFTITAPTSTNTSGAFTYTSSNTSVASVSGNTVTIGAQGVATITATQAAAGLYLQTAKTFTITVNMAPPTALSYPAATYTFTQGAAITPVQPTVTGTVTSYSISPALPAGLSFNTTTGVISGTPTTVSTATTYTVTATNSSGNTTTTVSIAVVIPAPSALSYNSPNTFTQGTAITPLQPTVTGTVTGYSISPALPAGLSLNTTTGVISGTPTAVAAGATYTITATNSTGSTTAQTEITVQVAAPSALSYTTPNVLTHGTAMNAIQPTVTGTVTSYSISPALPTGLAINSTTGVISGTPTAISAATVYTITASNSTGSTTASLTLSVQMAAPSGLSYASPNVFTIGITISPLQPTVTGTVTSYSINPGLPSGLVFNTTTGEITGMPGTTSPATVYTVTASNSTGATTATVSIGVMANVTYVSPAAPLAVGEPITPIPPAVVGTGFTYSISPGLPSGLSIDPTTGIISGTPTDAFTATTFTVTASNGMGSVTAPVTLGVVLLPPSGISYAAAQTATLATGASIAPIVPQVTGQQLSFSISPSLPAGLSFDPATGIITGTPTGISGLATFTVTATNASGSVSTTVSISVTGSLGALADMTKTYGDAPFAVTPPTAPAPGTYSYSSSNTGVATISGNTVTIRGVGTTTITATYSFAGGGTATTTSTLTVQPKQLLVKANNAAMCAGAAMPQLSCTITGYVNGENKLVLSQQPVATAAGSSATGVYPIAVSGGAAANYSFTYEAGSLTVNAPANRPQRMAPVDAAQGMPTQLKARSFGVSYQWTQPLLLSDANSPWTMATIQQETEFRVAITESNGCVVTDTVLVRIHKGPEVYVPSMFSPNGDGMNDVLYANPVHMQRLLYLRVYNPWGKLLFVSKDFSQGWNGQFEGKLQPFATYVWMVSAIDKNGKIVNRSGTVTLVR